MTVTNAYILFGAAILMIEAIRTLINPHFVLNDLNGDLPAQSGINFRALAGGAPLSSSLFLAGGLYLGVSDTVLLGYLGLVLAVVAVIRLGAAIGKPNIGKQYVAVLVEVIAAIVAIVLATH